jgi:hypothetical protein
MMIYIILIHFLQEIICIILIRGRSVGIVRSRTQATEFSLVLAVNLSTLHQQYFLITAALGLCRPLGNARITTFRTSWRKNIER